MKKEESLQIQICTYLKLQYPNVVFFSDASGIRLTIGQAVKAKKMRSGRAIPDLFIAEPRGQYSGLFLELKSVSIYKKNGELKADSHLFEQRDMLNVLMSKGYQCHFGCGFEHTKNKIDHYLK